MLYISTMQAGQVR